MAIFRPLDVMGPANRSGTIQQIAQDAAQNVMRRQRMRQLLQNFPGRGQGVAGGFPGQGVPFGGSTHGHAVGLRGATMGAFLPGGGPPRLAPGMFAGYDHAPTEFGSLPSNDPHQSPQSQLPPYTAPTPYAGISSQPASQPAAGPTDTTSTGGEVLPNAFGPGEGEIYYPSAPAPSAPIPLGGGLYYDPATDTVRGGTSY